MTGTWKRIAEQHLAASRAGRNAAQAQFSNRTDLGRRNLFIVCLVSSLVVLGVGIYGAYKKGSSSEMVVVVLLWGALVPFLYWWRFRRKARRTSS